MGTYSEEVQEKFRRMENEELVRRARSGNLTSTAHEIAVAELSRRGISLDHLPNEITEEVTLREKNPQVRPWVRYWARMFDIGVFNLPSVILLGIVAPHFMAQKGSEYLLGFVDLFLWVFVEALLLSSFGTTPGKWLFKIKLSSTSGKAISYSQAISRSIKVWWRGLGTGFPIVSLFTLINAHKRLKQNAITSWDREGNFVVSHEKIGVLRVLVAIAYFMVVFIVTVVAYIVALPDFVWVRR